MLTNWSGIELKRTGETRSDPPTDRKTFPLFFNSEVSEKMAEGVVIVRMGFGEKLIKYLDLMSGFILTNVWHPARGCLLVI